MDFSITLGETYFQLNGPILVIETSERVRAMDVNFLERYYVSGKEFLWKLHDTNTLAADINYSDNDLSDVISLLQAISKARTTVPTTF
jgi:hypothetical protein